MSLTAEITGESIPAEIIVIPRISLKYSERYCCLSVPGISEIMHIVILMNIILF